MMIRGDSRTHAHKTKSVPIKLTHTCVADKTNTQAPIKLTHALPIKLTHALSIKLTHKRR